MTAPAPTGLTRRRVLTVLAAAAPALALGPGAPRAAWRGRALGAEASITLYGDHAEAALAAARDALRRVEAAASLFDPGSELSRLNRDGRLRAPSADFLALMEVAGQVHAVSDGAFDPTVQPLWRLMAETRGRPPDAALAAARGLTGWEMVRVDARELAFARPGMALTLNGIAQGFAADRAAAALAAHGFEHALVSAGEWRALGGGWRLGSPFGPLRVEGEAVATSAPGALLLGGSGHILSPFGAESLGFAQVTVRAPSAALADGLSTALCAAGPGRAAAIMARVPGARALGRLGHGGEVAFGFG